MNVHTKPVSAPGQKISWWRTCVGEEEIANVVESIRAGHISSGPVTARLEAALAETLGVPYVGVHHVGIHGADLGADDSGRGAR